MIAFYDMVVEDKVSVWVGEFQSETLFFDFIDFVYNSDGESTNQFCQEAGFEWFDHDFQEANYLGEEKDLSPALQGHSWIGSFKESLMKALLNVPRESFNAIFLLYDFHYQPEIANSKDDSRLRFIGSFNYQKD